MQTVFSRILSRITVLCVAAMLLACDFNGDWMMRELKLSKLQVGIATETEVVGIMGKPDQVWHNDDHSKTLVYPMGPEGVHTWMVDVSSAGFVRAIRQVLDETNFEQIVPAMTHEQVRHLFGKPRSVTQFKRKGEEVWEWKYKNVYEERLFNVHFDISTGLVVRTSYSEIFNR